MERNFDSLAPGRRIRQPDCPDPLVWYEIASGTLVAGPTQQHIQHATVCEYCGCLLAEAVSDLSDETTAAEAKEVAALTSARPHWQRRLAQRITGTAPPVSEPAPWWSRWKVRKLVLVAAGLAVAVIAGQQLQMQTAEKLLARAYSDERPIELRMAGAKHAKFTAERGPTASLMDRPASLLLAEALLSIQMGSRSSDARWLHAKARADLLDGKYEAARESLSRALQLSPKSPGILTDLATAHAQQGDYAAAFEALSQVLALKPDDPVALFNRAIVAHQLHLYHQALDDAERYLRIEPLSEWAGEASSRADKIRGELKEHDQSRATPLLSPSQLMMAADDPNLRAQVDQRIEEYLTEAAVSWLPQAYPGTAGEADPAAQQALFFLADLTSLQHNDRWLSDLLHGSSSVNFPSAVAALGRAIHDNEAGEYVTATEHSVQADRLFRASGNVPGFLRAQFEQTLADQMTRRSESCRRRANTALAESRKHSYPWVQVQLELEKGVCSFLMGDIGGDERATAHAMELASTSGYGAIYLRAVFFAASDKLSTGDQPGAAKLEAAALQNFWSAKFPAGRGFNLYVAGAEIARLEDQPNLQLATWREATVLIDSGADLLQRAWAHNSMANAAAAAHQPEVAERQYTEAARIFALTPQTDANRNYAIDTGIRIARLEARFGRFDAAIARLTSIQNQVRPLSNNYLVQLFYSTLGELQLSRHREPEAEQALRPALALAERSLTTLKSEAERTRWSKDAAPAYLALIEAELAQDRPQDALETYEWYLGAPQRVPAHPYPPRSVTAAMPDPPPLEPRLPLLTNETVLAYAVLPDGLAIWAYDDRGVNAQWIPKQTDDLRELAARFHDLSSNPKSEMSALRRDAHSLYAALIAPVEQHIVPGRTLVIEAEGWLAGVPFEALLDSHDHYLVERTAIVHSLGQESQSRLRSDSGISAGLPALVVGSTSSSTVDGLIPLPDVAAEADTVAGDFHSATVLKGTEATFNAVRDRLPETAVFHFAGHSLATSEKAGLMLAGETRSDAPLLLEADVLRRVKLPTMRLAVLSACSTAAGSGGSSGFNSITEALLRAGVPHVVASRWGVDSVEARAFVEDFYRNALGGQPVSDAVRLSSRKMLSNTRTAHPYYWSAFAAYGRP